jgi:hypothetical protein
MRKDPFHAYVANDIDRGTTFLIEINHAVPAD